MLFRPDNWPKGVRLIEDIMERVPAEVQQQRYDICKSCDQFIKLTNQCKRCNCFLNLKTWFARVRCPLEKWEAYGDG